MDIIEAKTAKKLLETEIVKLIQNFEKGTGLKVKDVVYSELSKTDNAGLITVKTLKVKVEI